MTQKALSVKGYRLMVKPDDITMKVGSFVIAGDKQLERAGQIIGTVVEIGHLCWTQYEDDTPWCQVGDAVLYSRYAGKFVTDPASQEEFVLLNDEDIICTVAR